MNLVKNIKKSVITSGLIISGLLMLAAPTLAVPMQETSYKGMETFGINDGLVESETPGDISAYAMQEGYVDGGYWIRGTEWANVISEYIHYSGSAHASVINGNGYYQSGGWTNGPNQWSKARKEATFSGNTAYYNWR